MFLRRFYITENTNGKLDCVFTRELATHAVRTQLRSQRRRQVEFSRLRFMKVSARLQHCKRCQNASDLILTLVAVPRTPSPRTRSPAVSTPVL